MNKFVVVFWLLLDLRGLRAGNTSGILNKLSEWSEIGTGITGHMLKDFPYYGKKVANYKTAQLLSQV